MTTGQWAAAAVAIVGLSVTTLGLASEIDSEHAIEMKARELAPELRARFYARPRTMHNLTDGVGHQLFRGSEGPGAIYWTAKADAHLVYGPVFEAWRRHEDYLGYPTSDETDARGSCRVQGATREQEFGRVSWEEAGRIVGATVTICWSPDRGAWVMPSEPFAGIFDPTAL